MHPVLPRGLKGRKLTRLSHRQRPVYSGWEQGRAATPRSLRPGKSGERPPGDVGILQGELCGVWRLKRLREALGFGG